MKRLVCEMCGGTDLLKQDGVFVCQSCGTKYSVEEAKKMMVEGPVDVSGSVIKVDQSDKLKNLLNLARRSRLENNSEDAKKYYELALIEDPTSWESAFYSMYYKLMETSVGDLKNSLPLFNNRLISTILLLLSDDSPESPDKIKAILKDLTNSSIHLYSLISKQIVKYHAKEDSDFSMEFMSYVMKNKPYDSLSKRHRENQNSQFDMANSMVNQLLFVYKAITDDGRFAEDETLEAIRNFCETIMTFYAGEKQLSYIRNMNTFGPDLVEMQELFRRRTPNYSSKSITVFRDSLRSKIRSLEKDGYREDAKKYKSADSTLDRAIVKKEEEAKKQRYEEYWAEHAAERKQLEERKRELEQSMEPLRTEIDEIQLQINSSLNKRKKTLPAEEEKKELTANIEKLKNERSSLGLFKGKEKKELSEKIDALSAKTSEIDEKIKTQRGERDKEIDAEVQRLHEKMDPLTQNYATIEKDLKEIDTELTCSR